MSCILLTNTRPNKMGIPYYFYVLMKNYPRIVHTTVPAGRCSDFFMDFNGAIHNAVNQVSTSFSEDAVLERTWDYLQECLRIANPSKMVHICTDGVAPIAKMNQQRKRRYISVWKNKKMGGDAPVWDRNAISPGTPFMSKLQAYMSRRIRDRDDLQTHYYYSGADEAGEGEHKIFARIASMGGERHDGNVIIHGLDADLIMLSLISHKPRIFLMREPMGAYKDMATSDGFMFVEIDRLRSAIIADLRTHFKWPIDAGVENDAYSSKACEIIDTYVTLCSVLGNDFLPHPVTLALKKNGYDALLHAAKHAWIACGGRPLVAENHDINYPFLTEVFTRLADSEDADLWKCNEEYLKRKPFENEDDPLDPYPLMYKDPLCNVVFASNPRKWRQFYYKHLFHTRMHDTTVISTSCRLFVQGIAWVYRYYKRLAKDPEWYYPFNYSPSLRDLANFMAGVSAADTARFTENFTVPATRGFVNPNVQLLCIMPRESAPVLPRKVAEIMRDPKGMYSHMFPVDYDIQTYMKTHLWECTPVLPALDVALFEKAIAVKAI